MRGMVKRDKLAATVAVAALAGSLLSPALAEQSSMSDSQGVNLTIYNQNFGLVKDTRLVDLVDGINHVRFEDVAAAIDPTSVSFVSLTAPNGVVVREQNYQFDLMDPTTILNKSVGKTAKFKQYLSSGAVQELTGVLLNPPMVSVSDSNGNVSQRSQGLVVKTDNGIVLNPSGQVELAEMPGGLVSKPSLLWKIEATKGGKHKTEVSYQTAGMSWKCDYVAVCDDDDASMDITSWVTLDNKSGASYKNAALKLLAGDVHRVTAPPVAYGRGVMMAAEKAAPQFQEKSFAEYHLYTLQGKTDVNDKETKQLSLFNANKVPSRKLFIYEPEAGVRYGNWYPGGRDPQKVNVKLEVNNTAENQLGMALPKGKVRVYKRDHDGALQFIGEDMIDHTPRDEKIRLYIGDAFDVVGERKQMNFQQVSNHIQRYQIEISLRNHKDSDVTVTAVEHAHGQWKVLEESHQHKKKDSTTLEFEVKVPKRGEVKINYEIEVKY